MERKPRHSYLDPLDSVWLTVAKRIGFRVERSMEVYASTDGMGVMSIGHSTTLDADDCLAQMILHELCHSLIEGRESIHVADFGLDNESEQDLQREHACLRLQAWLTTPYGLRRVLAPTTDFRGYYDALPSDPLGPADDPAVAMARAGAGRSEEPPWAPHLRDGLDATAKIIGAAFEVAAQGLCADLPPIWSEFQR